MLGLPILRFTVVDGDCRTFLQDLRKLCPYEVFEVGQMGLI